MNYYKQTDYPSPIEVLEELIEQMGYSVTSFAEHEIGFDLASDWGEFNLVFTWSEETNTLSVACAIAQYQFAPKAKESYELLALINQRLWLGHFEISEDGVAFFRYTLILPESISDEEINVINEVMHTAINECERFDPVFHFHFAGKSPQAAIDAAMLEPKGEA